MVLKLQKKMKAKNIAPYLPTRITLTGSFLIFTIVAAQYRAST